jgi:hypothetical protein
LSSLDAHAGDLFEIVGFFMARPIPLQPKTEGETYMILKSDPDTDSDPDPEFKPVKVNRHL